MSTLVALVVELPLCFLVFYPSWEGRLLVFIANAGLMGMINLTGTSARASEHDAPASSSCCWRMWADT
jgi:hypothetical protein